MKPTFQPSNIKHKRDHGFRKRMSTKQGRAVLKRRRARGRKRLIVWHYAWKFFSADGTCKKKRQFDSVFAEGVKIKSRHFTCYFLRSTTLSLGVVVSKKIGIAPVRNRAKRIVRELFRTHKSQITVSGSLIVIPSYRIAWKTESYHEAQLSWHKTVAVLNGLVWKRYFYSLSPCISGLYHRIYLPVVFIIPHAQHIPMKQSSNMAYLKVYGSVWSGLCVVPHFTAADLIRYADTESK